jgi:hypothetical protein
MRNLKTDPDWEKKFLDRSTPRLRPCGSPYFPTEKEVLEIIPEHLHNFWESYMRGKTCPRVDEEPRVYPWDLPGFLKTLPDEGGLAALSGHQ